MKNHTLFSIAACALMALMALMASVGLASAGVAGSSTDKSKDALRELHKICVSQQSLDGAVFGCLDPDAKTSNFARKAVVANQAEASALHEACLFQPTLDGAAFGCLDEGVQVQLKVPAPMDWQSVLVPSLDAIQACLAQPSLDGAVFGYPDGSGKTVPPRPLSLAWALPALRLGEFGEGCRFGCPMLAP